MSTRRGRRSNSRGTKAVADHGAAVYCSKCKQADPWPMFVTPGHTSCGACRKPGTAYIRCTDSAMARRFHRDHRTDGPWIEVAADQREVLPLGPIPMQLLGQREDGDQ